MNLAAHLYHLALACGVRLARHRAARQNTTDGRARWLDLHNKLAALHLFTGAPAIQSLDSYSLLFAAEGLAYRQAQSGVPLRDLLLLEPDPVSVHAGAGLALAQRILRQLQVRDPFGGRSARTCGLCAPRSREILDTFFDTCNRDARDGFAGIMHEMLGFAARVSFPRLVGSLAGFLRDDGDSHRARFWHGVGRAIYFLPRHVPVSRAVPWLGVTTCHQVADDELSLNNALSGFSFALTLVNLHSPEVLDAFARRHDTSHPAIADGMGSARAVSHSECARPESLFSMRAVPSACQPVNARQDHQWVEFSSEVKP